MKKKEVKIGRIANLLSKEKPIIDTSDRNLMRLCDEAWDALKEANDPPFLFRYGNTIVEIISEKNDPCPLVSPLSPDRLRHHMARVAHWKVQTDTGIKNIFPLVPVM